MTSSIETIPCDSARYHKPCWLDSRNDAETSLKCPLKTFTLAILVLRTTDKGVRDQNVML